MNSRPLNRRELLKRGTAGIVAGTAVGAGLTAHAQTGGTATKGVINGRIRQSIMGWCFRDHMDAVTLAGHCKEIGLVAMEGISAEHYPAIKEMGLEVSLVPGIMDLPRVPVIRSTTIWSSRASLKESTWPRKLAARM